MRVTWMPGVIVGGWVLIALVQAGGAQQRTAPPPVSATTPAAGDWPSHRHDAAGTGFSPLTQINTKNVSALARVWTYRLQSDAPAPAAGGRGGGGGVNSE